MSVGGICEVVFVCIDAVYRFGTPIQRKSLGGGDVFFKPRCNGESGLGDAAFHVACTARDDGGFVVLRGNESHPSHSVAGDEFSDFDVGNAKSQRIATRLGIKGGFRAPISFLGFGRIATKQGVGGGDHRVAAVLGRG